MKTVWTKGLEKDEAAEMRSLFTQSARVRVRLSQILSDKMDAADNASLSKDGYETANWAYKQADTVGYRRAIKEILSIIEK